MRSKTFYAVRQNQISSLSGRKKNIYLPNWFTIIIYNNYTSHDSVSVVRTTFKVYGKRQTLTLSQPKTPKPIVTKFEWRD